MSKHHSAYLLAIVAILLIGIVLGDAGQTAADASNAGRASIADSCRNVKFRVTNGRNISIDLKQVKYYNASEGRWQTEDIKNSDERCDKGGVCILMQGEDLRDSEGDRLTKIIFVFKDVNSNKTQESEAFVPTDPVCRAEKEYGHGQNWTITGHSATSGSTGSESDGSGDTCENVSFLVRNNSGKSMWIDKVKYYNRNSGKWNTEDVADTLCMYSETLGACTIGGRDNLADANNDDITKIIFLYRLGYGEPLKESQSFTPNSPKCVEGKIYGTGQGWTIGK